MTAFTSFCLIVLQAAVAYRPVPAAFGQVIEGIQVGGTFGVDVSQPVSVDSFECMKSNGIQFVIVRAYQSIG